MSRGGRLLTEGHDMFDCPVCETSYDTEQEANACRDIHLANGVVQTPDGSYAYAEDVLDDDDNWL
jgi:hypothetical protein